MRQSSCTTLCCYILRACILLPQELVSLHLKNLHSVSWRACIFIHKELVFMYLEVLQTFYLQSLYSYAWSSCTDTHEEVVSLHLKSLYSYTWRACILIPEEFVFFTPSSHPMNSPISCVGYHAHDSSLVFGLQKPICKGIVYSAFHTWTERRSMTFSLLWLPTTTPTSSLAYCMQKELRFAMLWICSTWNTSYDHVDLSRPYLLL